MSSKKLIYQKIEKNYLKFLKSQEILSEPFRDKRGQLINFYLPISKKIHEIYIKKKILRLLDLQGDKGLANQQSQIF